MPATLTAGGAGRPVGVGEWVATRHSGLWAVHVVFHLAVEPAPPPPARATTGAHEEGGPDEAAGRERDGSQPEPPPPPPPPLPRRGDAIDGRILQVL